MRVFYGIDTDPIMESGLLLRDYHPNMELQEERGCAFFVTSKMGSPMWKGCIPHEDQTEEQTLALLEVFAASHEHAGNRVEWDDNGEGFQQYHEPVEQVEAKREMLTEQARELVGQYDVDFRTTQSLCEIVWEIAEALDGDSLAIPDMTNPDWLDEILTEGIDKVNERLPETMRDACWYGIDNAVLTVWQRGPLD